MPVKGRRITRQILLDGAADLLDQGVYGDLTVDALARHLAMSKSTMYKHFIGKDDVVVALVDEVCTQTLSDLDAIAGSTDPTNEFDALAQVFAGYADRLPRAVILQHAKLPRKSKRQVDAVRTKLTEAVADVLRRGAGAGAFATTNHDVAAAAFTASCFAVIASTAEVHGKRSDAIDQVLELFRPGLAA